LSLFSLCISLFWKYVCINNNKTIVANNTANTLAIIVNIVIYPFLLG